MWNGLPQHMRYHPGTNRQQNLSQNLPNRLRLPEWLRAEPKRSMRCTIRMSGSFYTRTYHNTQVRQQRGVLPVWKRLSGHVRNNFRTDPTPGVSGGMHQRLRLSSRVRAECGRQVRSAVRVRVQSGMWSPRGVPRVRKCLPHDLSERAEPEPGDRVRRQVCGRVLLPGRFGAASQREVCFAEAVPDTDRNLHRWG
uniref:(northern house mosquito) hypothetical protein n=1 Tax=Culex pipiens TaxID=7175 RepID=A0A8D8G238_CULPI